MCLACQMEEELWFAYLDHVAQQQKQSAAEMVPAPAAEPAKPIPTPKTAAPAAPFVCEEQPTE
jgi:hypothetical protein